MRVSVTGAVSRFYSRRRLQYLAIYNINSLIFSKTKGLCPFVAELSSLRWIFPPPYWYTFSVQVRVISVQNAHRPRWTFRKMNIKWLFSPLVVRIGSLLITIHIFGVTSLYLSMFEGSESFWRGANSQSAIRIPKYSGFVEYGTISQGHSEIVNFTKAPRCEEVRVMIPKRLGRSSQLVLLPARLCVLCKNLQIES